MIHHHQAGGTARRDTGGARRLRARATFLTRLLFSSGAVLLTAAASPAAAPDSLKFRYRLQPGASYDGTMTISLTTEMTMEGLPEEAAAMAQTIGKDLKQEITMKTVLSVGPAEEDGSVPVEYRIVDGQVAVTMAGQPIDMPGVKDAFSNSPSWRGRMSSEGRRLEVSSQAVKDVPGLPPDMVDRIAQAMPAFPDRELKVGDSFEIPIKMALPGLPMSGRMMTDSKCIYTLRSLGEGEAIFDMISTVSGSMGEDGTERMMMKLTGGGAGKAVFDLKEGIFTSSRTEMKVDMAMEMPLPTGPDPPPANEPAAGPKVVKIRATMQGPAEHRMSRAASPK